MGISFKGFTIGIVASIAVCLVVSYAELVVKYIQIGFLQLPPVVVGLFCFILLVTAWTKRTKSRFRLTPQELLTVYCMMLLSSMISSRGCLEKILPLLPKCLNSSRSASSRVCKAAKGSRGTSGSGRSYGGLCWRCLSSERFYAWPRFCAGSGWITRSSRSRSRSFRWRWLGAMGAGPASGGIA